MNQASAFQIKQPHACIGACANKGEKQVRRLGALGIAALLLGAILPARAAETNGTTVWTGVQGGNTGTTTTSSGLTETATTANGTNGLVSVGLLGTAPLTVSTPLNARGATAAMFDPTALAVAATQSVNIAVNPQAGCPNAPANQTQATCSNMGTITLTFSRPVRNPTLHITGLGANTTGGLLGTAVLRLNARLTLTGSSPAGATLGTVSAGAFNLQQASQTIETVNVDASTSCANTNDGEPTAARSGCGSVNVVGVVTSLTFAVSMKYRFTDCPLLGCAAASPADSTDAFNLAVSFPQDFSDAPASFGVPRHVIGDLRVGSANDADRTNTENPTASSFAATSPNDAVGDDTEVSAADDNEPGDDEEGVAFGSGLSTALIGSTYTTAVVLSGASQAGEVCGWIDFDHGGAFETTERACTTFAAGATSATLGWTVPAATTPGLAYARIRAAYGAAGGSVNSPTGAVASGEVEDHQLNIMQPSFGTCDARMFLSQGPNSATNTTLYDINTGSNPFTFPAIGQGSNVYNAIGFNPLDNFIYGIDVGGGSGNHLIRIGADGSSVDLGAVGGMAVANWNNGAFSPSGTLYVLSAGGSVNLRAINVATNTSTLITLSSSVNSSDLAWVGGLLYTVTDAGQLKSINPTTGAVTNIGSPSGAITLGAMFGAPNGLFGSANGGGFYQIDLATGARTLISGSPGSGVNDGAHCVNANITFAADLSVTKTNTPGVNGDVDQATDTYTPGTGVVYTIVVANNGPFGVQNATVGDPLPAGIATASWTCVAAGGGVCDAASGTGAISDTPDLPVGATATYALTVTVPSNFTGNLSNTATVGVPPSNTDPTPGNNTATDTDTQNSVANLSITKASTPEGPFTPGQTVSYAIVVSNGGPSSADGAAVHDPVAAGLDCTAITSCTPVGGATCPGALTISGLQTSPGLAIPTFPNGGSVTFVLSCQVTATGQ